MKKTLNHKRFFFVSLLLIISVMIFSTTFHLPQVRADVTESNATEETSYSFIGASVNADDLKKIRFGFVFDESKTVKGFADKIEISFESSKPVTDKNPYFVLTFETEYSKNNDKRMYLITLSTPYYYDEMICVAKVFYGEDYFTISSQSRSIYSTWKMAIEDNSPAYVNANEEMRNEILRRDELFTNYGYDYASQCILYGDKISELQDEILKLQDENKSLKQEIENKDDFISDDGKALLSENENLKAENDSLKNQNEDFSKQVEKLNSRVEQLTGDNAVVRFVNNLFRTDFAPIVCYLIIVGFVVAVVGIILIVVKGKLR